LKTYQKVYKFFLYFFKKKKSSSTLNW